MGRISSIKYKLFYLKFFKIYWYYERSMSCRYHIFCKTWKVFHGPRRGKRRLRKVVLITVLQYRFTVPHPEGVNWKNMTDRWEKDKDVLPGKNQNTNHQRWSPTSDTLIDAALAVQQSRGLTMMIDGAKHSGRPWETKGKFWGRSKPMWELLIPRTLTCSVSC